MEELFNFDFFDDDINENPAEEGVGGALLIGAAAIAGGAAGTAIGNGIGNGISGAVHKKRHKKEIANDGELTDKDWETFKKGIQIAKKGCANHLRQAILDGNPNIDEVSSTPNKEKYINSWSKYIILVNSYDENKIRKDHMCPMVDIKGKWYGMDTGQMQSILRCLRKLVNNDLQSAKLPCRMVETDWGGCVLGLQYRKSSSAKESVEIPYFNISNVEEYLRDTELTYIAFESAMLNYEVSMGIYDDECYYDEDTEAIESASDDMFAFGAGLFEDTIASELTPATEGIGTSIANGIKTIFNAIKNFFIKIANAVKNIGKKKTESTTTNDKKEEPSSNSGPAKYPTQPSSDADVSKIVAQMNTVISILNTEISGNGQRCKQVQTRINNAFNNALSKVDRMVGANANNLTKVSDEYTRDSGDTTSAVEKDLDKSRQVAQDAANGVKRAQDAMDKMSQQYMAIMKQHNYETTKLKADVMKKFEASSIANVRRLCEQIANVSGDNVNFCNTALNKYTSREDLKPGPARIGYDLCKIYLQISRTFSSLSISLTKLSNGSVFGT